MKNAFQKFVKSYRNVWDAHTASAPTYVLAYCLLHMVTFIFAFGTLVVAAVLIFKALQQGIPGVAFSVLTIAFCLAFVATLGVGLRQTYLLVMSDA